MTATRRNMFVTATAAALVAAVAILPAGAGIAAERGTEPSLPYELDVMAPPSAEESLPALSPVADTADQRCMAKVVHHEAGNQPRAGMVAVAQTLMNRLRAGGRFGNSICAVANQRGQYFDTSSYRPREDSDAWQAAMAVAGETISGKARPIVSGALFFRAAYAPASSFFRSRERVAAIGDHIFYR